MVDEDGAPARAEDSAQAHDEAPPSRLRRTATARTVALAGALLAAIAVAALGVFVANARHPTDHGAACQRYRSALVVAYADPLSTVPVTGLSTRDAAQLTANRSLYQSLLRMGSSEATPTLWQNYVTKIIGTAMVGRRC